MSNTEFMKNGSLSLCTELTLVALAELQLVLFFVFLVIYLFTVGGNLTIICVIWVTSSLHTPVYFFLANLSFLEMCYISSVVPQMLVHLLVQFKTMSVGGCAAQIYLLPTALHSADGPFCLFEDGWGILDDWDPGRISPDHLDLHSALLWSRNNSALFCDIMPVVKLACVDTSQNEIVLFIISLIFIMCPCLFILCSYVCIILTILKMPSAAGRHKAFSTCSSHILVVSLFYGTALFTYLQSKSSHTPDTDKATALMYTVVTTA